MKLILTPYHFAELQTRGYSLDIIFILKMIYEQVDISLFIKESPKIAVLYSTLIRKGLITEEEKITTMGKELLDFMETKESRRISKKKVDGDEFLLWWNEFPSSDIFDYAGKHFQGCRSLRQNKEECRAKFDKIVSEGEYSVIELIEALKYDVKSKKEASIKTGTNKLTYMQNSLTYLNQRSYEPFLELIKSGTKIIETNYINTGGTDI